MWKPSSRQVRVSMAVVVPCLAVRSRCGWNGDAFQVNVNIIHGSGAKEKNAVHVHLLDSRMWYLPDSRPQHLMKDRVGHKVDSGIQLLGNNGGSHEGRSYEY
uniref:Secreted protein n=1 Tax=Oryza punctata TaxID=4537 RepID=A0A0E0JDN6_ORYPU